MSSKKPKTKNIRHILESPFQIKWVEKDAEEIVPIEEALLKHLPAAKLDKVPIDLQFKRKKDPKENTARKNVNAKQQNKYRTFLAPGYQSVVRGLEKGKLCCALVSSDITPSMLFNVLLVQAQVAGVPILVIPNLRNLLKSTLGFSAMALGFKNIVAESSEITFHEIFVMVSQNPTQISAPAFPIKGEREGEFREDVEGIEVSDNTLVKLSQPIKTENLYLYRSPNGKRAFIPEGNKAEYIQKPEIKTGMDESFILLEKDSETVKKAVKTKTNFIQRVSEDEDDSDDEVSFFIDTKADETLLERLEPMDILENETRKLGNSKSNKAQSLTNKHTSKHKKKKKKKKSDHVPLISKVNFKPLHIKTVTANPNRSKGKNKNKMK